MSLVLLYYRKYSPRVKYIIWMVTLPIMILGPVLSHRVLDNEGPVFEIDVLPAYGTIEIQSGAQIPEKTIDANLSSPDRVEHVQPGARSNHNDEGGVFSESFYLVSGIENISADGKSMR